MSAFLFGFAVGRDTAKSSAADLELIREAEEHIRQSSVNAPADEELLRGAIRGMVRTLGDPYAEYLDAASHRAYRDVTIGAFSGIGLLLRQEGKEAMVISVISDSPAARAGITSGDVVTQVDGEPASGLTLDEVVRSIQGDPGTPVRLTVLRADQRLEFSLVRENIEVPSVKSEMLRDRLGLVEISVFTQGTGRRVREAVGELRREGARGFIVDLRGNPGGVLEEAVDVASVFLDGGRVFSYKERNKSEVVYFAQNPLETKLPLVVLVDEVSASGSEIVAGAIKDRGRGILLGTRTFGKGSIQRVYTLSDGSGLKITTASYFTPSGKSIDGKGIQPDVSVGDKDLQLARARQILRELLASTPSESHGRAA